MFLLLVKMSWILSEDINFTIEHTRLLLSCVFKDVLFHDINFALLMIYYDHNMNYISIGLKAKFYTIKSKTLGFLKIIFHIYTNVCCAYLYWFILFLWCRIGNKRDILQIKKCYGYLGDKHGCYPNSYENMVAIIVNIFYCSLSVL